jgi:hypothetical protein
LGTATRPANAGSLTFGIQLDHSGADLVPALAVGVHPEAVRPAAVSGEDGDVTVAADTQCVETGASQPHLDPVVNGVTERVGDRGHRIREGRIREAVARQVDVEPTHEGVVAAHAR